MSLTFKFINDTRRNTTKSSSPIKVRVYSGTIYHEHSLRIQIKPEYWNPEQECATALCPDVEYINSRITSKRAAIKSMIMLAEHNHEVITSIDIVAALNKADGIQPRAKQRKKERQPTMSTSIFSYAKQRINEMEQEGKIGNAIVYTCATNKLKAFVGRDSFSWNELTAKVLGDWNRAMIKQELRVNSISNYMRTIRALYNAAVHDGLASRDNYPFSRIKIRTEKTISRSLTLEEMKRLVTLQLPEFSKMEAYRRMFLLSFCLIGTNFSDLLTLSENNLVEDRIIFQRKKTHKLYSIALPDVAADWLREFRSIPCSFQTRNLLPFINPRDTLAEQKRQILLVVSNANANLRKMAAMCGINKPITTYYARYAWANIEKIIDYTLANAAYICYLFLSGTAEVASSSKQDDDVEMTVLRIPIPASFLMFLFCNFHYECKYRG